MCMVAVLWLASESVATLVHVIFKVNLCVLLLIDVVLLVFAGSCGQLKGTLFRILLTN